MRLEPLECPPIFPDFVSCYSARLADGDHRVHFAAGRECAARAMAGLGIRPAAVDRGPAGEPLWPAGVTGSITHKGDYVSAAVARTSDVLSLGIDVEAIIDAERAARIAPVVMLPEEAGVGGSELSPALRVTLLFSIKEAVFKCLYPLVQKRFYYDLVVVTGIDPQQRVFRAELVADLAPAVPAGRTLPGNLALDRSRVYAVSHLTQRPWEPPSSSFR